MRPLQAAASASPPQGTCFGYNGVNDSYIPGIISGLRIALIQPVLTSTPYSQYDTGSFYAFYAIEARYNLVATNVTTNLNLLSTNVSSGYGYNQGWGLSYGEYQFFTSQAAVNCGLQVGKNVQVLTDMDVADGALFSPQNNASRFDVVVLPFSEYVEASEYQAYEDFVAGGGTLVMMGHSLEYPVTYNATTSVETLVYGHNWAFNGKYAYPIACGSNTYVASCPWASEQHRLDREQHLRGELLPHLRIQRVDGERGRPHRKGALRRVRRDGLQVVRVARRGHHHEHERHLDSFRLRERLEEPHRIIHASIQEGHRRRLRILRRRHHRHRPVRPVLHAAGNRPRQRRAGGDGHELSHERQLSEFARLERQLLPPPTLSQALNSAATASSRPEPFLRS